MAASRQRTMGDLVGGVIGYAFVLGVHALREQRRTLLQRSKVFWFFFSKKNFFL
jgi:hypothetical protein